MSRRIASRDNPALVMLLEQERQRQEEEHREARFDAAVCALIVISYAVLVVTGWHP